ncbi:phage terminase large subunit family protein (plasmid) [Escherichia coli]|nr:terminase gpA endonuclease subunit [Escherichia coli]MCH6240685.1 phage terminase large subunit family protein [Escherichia coli]
MGFSSARNLGRDISAGFSPPRRMPISEAVKKFMRVPKGAGNSVPWDPELTPYIIEPMNCLASREYDAVIFVGPARTGKTIGLIDGWIVYTIVCDPSDMLVVQMTEDKAREHSKKRLDRTFRSSAAVKKRMSPRRNDNNVHDKTFRDGSFLKIGWPSVNIMSSSDYRFVALTDYDRFPENIDSEGDGFSLASKRTTTFMSAGMTLVESSPGRDICDSKWRRKSPHEAPPTTGILSLYNRGDRRRWYWPCPHCGEYFQPAMDAMTGYRNEPDPFKASEAAYLLCPHCSGIITAEKKRELNSAGVWLREGQVIDRNGNVSGEPRRSRIASFWMEGPAAAYQTWAQLVYKLLTAEQEYEATGSEETLRAVINTDWGLPYLPRASMEQRKSELLEQRAEPVPSRSVPDGVNFLVATVDVQAGRHRRFVVQVTGYGSRGERWIIDRYNITQSLRSDCDGESQRIDPASYPNTALVGVQVDSEQFGSQQVSRNYHLRGRILQVPSSYNPQTRQYSGIWDGTFKPAYSNNMAWCLWDMLAHPRYGMGKRLGAADVDKWALYVIGQHCDQSVPDGFGGTEPRITCNAYLTTQRKAWDVLSDFCSAMRCMPVWNGQTLTFVQDRPSDKVWTYNRSNVVMPDDGAPFRYSFSALKDRHNAVEVNWIDPNNGWETATELVEDTQAIARYGRNVTKMDAFGCTSRGQAHRAGLWLIKTELLETQTVDFSVGAEGLRHVPGDVIEICDDDYAGIRTGGRVLAVNSQTRTLTLDREITLPSSGTTLISLVDGQGSPVSVEVQSVTDGVKVKVSRVPDGVAEYSVWGLKLPTLRQRLFRCVSIRENDDGTYAITAVQHVPEKEAIVDNGAHFDGDQSGTVNGVTPPAVQHLTAEVTADSGEYQVLARWDTPKVVKGVSFLLRLTVAADDGRERLVSTARTTETTYRFTQLALGNYRLTVRAVNAWGQQGDPASVSFRIAAPAAPSRIELTPGYFQITATPHLAVYDPTVQFEFWFSEKRIADIRQVETSARYLGTALYWIAASINIKPGHDYYFYVRSVNTVGKSAFVEAVGQPSDDASGYLDFFKGEIGKTHLAQELWTQIDNGQLAPDLTEIRTSITDVSNEITQTVNKKLEDQSAAIQQIQKVQVDTNNNLNSMWAVKLQQMQDGRLYIAGIGAGIENTPDGMQSQVLLAADRIAMINPANGNTKPMFVGQGDQIFMNEVFLKRLTAPTITSGGNPPAFSLTSDGRLTAKNADISGSVNANSGTLNNVTINQNCTIKGMLEATQVRGDFVKAVSKAFPKKVGTWGNTETPNGTVTVTISDDHNFDRQIIIPPIIFNGIAYDDPGSGNNPGGTRYTGYGFEVRKNGVLIASRETKGAIPGSYSAVIDMPSGRGSVTLEFKIFQKGNQGAGNITDCTVIVTKKAASGISIR